MIDQSAPYAVGIIGSRDFKGSVYTNDTYVNATMEAHMEALCTALGRRGPFRLVTGGGRGVESLVVKWAQAKGYPIRQIPPSITENGPRRAFVLRNNSIVADCTDLMVFWDGTTNIVGEALTTAMQTGKLTTLYPLV